MNYVLIFMEKRHIQDSENNHPMHKLRGTSGSTWIAFAVLSRNNGDEKRMRRNSRKFALAARICFLLGLRDGFPSSLRMLPREKTQYSNSRYHESQNVTFTSNDNYKLEGLDAYRGHLLPFFFLGGRPTPQLFDSYEKSSLQSPKISTIFSEKRGLRAQQNARRISHLKSHLLNQSPEL